MTDSTSERKLAENEVVFRKLNEKFLKGIEEVNAMAVEENQPEYLIIPKSDDQPVHFYCECADDKCTKRIQLRLHDYRELHLNNKTFVIVPGHEVPTIERVVKRHEPEFYLVEKFDTPPQDSTKLHLTNLHNT